VGTHIDSFFPRAVERSVDEALARLSSVFDGLTDDLAVIRERGRFSTDRSEWSLVEDNGEISGEGPSGFLITIYSQVVKFTSVERFGAMENPDFGIQEPLQHVFAAVARSLGTGVLAVSAGGFGDTDHASDLAAQGQSFANVCRRLKSVIGPPVRAGRN
jgi:hypothetical protein